MTPIENLISVEENKLNQGLPTNETINILFNLITLKNRNGQKADNYKDIKSFVNNYITVIKVADYGYDNFNYDKIETLLKLLTPGEQVTVLQFAISATSRELPEHNRDWFIERKHSAEIKYILTKKNAISYPKAFFLFTGLNITRLFFALILFFLIINILLLPSASNTYSLFKIEYASYSSNFLINHILNVLSLFADLDNNFKIEPLNWWGLILMIVGKISFVLLMVNFIYRKICDKISLK